MEDKFNDKLFQVLRNFMEYGNYGGNANKAIGIITKSFPDRTKEECTLLFNTCCEAYKDAVVLVKENHEHYAQPSKTVQLEAEIAFRSKYKEVSEPMLTWIISWIYHWYYER